MSHATMPADEIQRQMRAVRAELREDVQELVASTQVLTAWQSYVRAYPWVCVGAAAAAGYLLIPSKATRFVQPDATTLRELVQSVATASQPARGPSLTAMLARMAVGSLLQGGLALLSQHLQQQLQNRVMPSESPAAETEEQPDAQLY
ncbi:MAG: hypothetical protein SFU86_06470 [Pirellulaceae bacterium]|nr:hypothetical protein [Pirellulaceae bacterium]